MARLKTGPKVVLIFAAVAAIAYGLTRPAVKEMVVGSLPAETQAKINTQSATAPQEQRPSFTGLAAPKVQAGNFDSWARIQASHEIKVAVQGSSAPFYNNAAGFNVDYLKLVLKQPEFNGLSARVVTETNTYAEVPLALLEKAGSEPKVDIAIDGLTFQDGDVGGVTYTVPYVTGFGYSLITNRTSGIRNVETVGSKRVGVLKGDPDARAVAEQAFPSAQIIELSDALIGGQRTWIDNAFKTGQVEAIVYDYPFAVAEINGTALQFAVSKLPNTSIAYKIGVRVGDDVLMAKLNSAIGRVSETEEYRELLRKYFTSNKIVTTRATGGERTYTVKSGDTLSTIAASQLGDRMRFPAIETRNNLPNPNLIHVGQVLVIPN